MSDIEKRKLSELRVVDLKQELEKRGKDGSGVKNVLIERLTQALKEENKNPETYEFELMTGKTPAKKAKPATGANKSEDDTADNPAASNGTEASEAAKEEGNDESTEANKEAKESACVKKETGKSGEETKEADNEDSLNLTIGEEDEKLLHEDSNTEADKKGTDKDSEKKEGETKSADDANKSEKTETAGDKAAGSKDEKENAGKASANSAKSGSSEKSKSSPNLGEKTTTVSRNLWVSGLSSLTRATDLKLIFSKYGKVIGAKVVTNTRTPGTRCYGYVTMASAKDATECITHLHRTELHGRMISVERAKGDLAPAKVAGSGGKADSASAAGKPTEGDASKEKDKEEKKEDGKGTHERGRSQHRSKSEFRGKSHGPPHDTDKSREDRKPDDSRSRDGRADNGPNRDARFSRDRRERDLSRKDRQRSREREVLSLQKIREERERQRQRDKERRMREEERRRRERQREEEQVLRREREKLALERARIEKEKVELLRIERERQKLEREKIELERLELKRQQRKIEEAKRNMNMKRAAADHPHYDEDRKRVAGPDRRFEAPPPPTISASGRGPYPGGPDKKRMDDYPAKRDEYKSRPQMDDYRRDSFKRNGGVMDDYKRDMDRPMQQMDSRYPDNRSGGGGGGGDYRGDDRDRNGGMPKSRYMDNMDGGRYSDRSGGGGGGSGPWNSGPPQMSMAQAMGNDTWRMDNTQDRYDRTYNERKGPQMNAGQFMDSSRQSQFVGGGGGRPQDRYGANMSNRFDNGRY